MLSRKIVMILSSLTILSLLLGGLVYYNMAQAQNNNSYIYHNFMSTVTPESPTVDDHVNASFSFDLASISYAVNFSLVSKVGNDFFITIDIYVPYGLILPMIEHVQETFNLGELINGVYTFYADVRVWDEETGFSIEQASYSKSFTVKAVRRYDPWNDVNDDGSINILDIASVAVLFGTFGTPINKTELLLDLTSKVETSIFQSGLLLQLPYGATHMDFTPDTNTILLSLDLNQTEPGNQQSVFTYEGTTLTISGVFQNMDFPGTISQVFFIYSWTPSWPPPPGYYHELYNGSPGPYPGVTQSFSFDLVIPEKGGVYYLYLCSGAQYNMLDAVNQYTQPLWVPYAVIIASAE